MKNNDRHHNLSFSQRYKYEARPKPMQLEQLSNNLRRAVWNVVYRLLDPYIEELDPWKAGLYEVNMHRFTSKDIERFVVRAVGEHIKQPEDKISPNDIIANNFLRQVILDGKFNKVLDFIEILVNDESELLSGKKMQALFEQHGAAYRLDMTQPPFQFFPCASKEQGDAIQKDMETLRNSSMAEATIYLRKAAAHINNRNFPDSVASSIMAVESVARAMAPNSKTLGQALNSLEKAGCRIHPALKKAFQQLYGYTNDENRIRHAIISEDNTDVSIDEAVFMFGACASFTAYLASKHRQMRGGKSGDN